MILTFDQRRAAWARDAEVRRAKGRACRRLCLRLAMAGGAMREDELSGNTVVRESVKRGLVEVVLTPPDRVGSEVVRVVRLTAHGRELYGQT